MDVDINKNWGDILLNNLKIPEHDIKDVEISETSKISTNEKIKYGTGKPYRITISGDIKENGRSE